MPFDPRLSTDPQLRQDYAPQIRAADQADRAAAQAAESQARDAEQAQKEQARAAEAAAKQAQTATNLANERLFKQTNRPSYKDEAGNIVSEQDDAAFAAAQQSQAAKAAKITQYQQEGRRYRPNPVDDSITVLDSDAVLEQRKKDAAEKMRRASIDQRIQAHDAEVNYQSTAEKIKPLSETGVTNLRKQLDQAKSDAAYALSGKLTPKTQQTDKAGFWDVMNNNPTPEATAASARLERLSQPDAALDDQDLADLEADPTTAPTAQKIRTITGLLGKHEEAAKFQQTAAERRAELVLRRDSPDKWADFQRQKIQSMDATQLDQHVQASDADLAAKQSDLESRYQQISELLTRTQTEQKALKLKNEEALKSGVPAGELVTMQDGSQWHKPLAAALFDLQAKSDQHVTDHEPQRQQIEAEAEDLKVELALRNEAAQRAQDLQKTAKGDVQAVQSFMPGMERASAQSRSIQADFEARAADLADMYPEDSPQRQAAVEALQSETQAKLEQTNAEGVQTHAAAQAAYQGYKQRLAEDPKLNAQAGELFVTARKNLAQALGIDEKEADRILNDVESHDWTTRQGKHGEDMEGPGNGTGIAQFMNEARGDKRQFRMLSNGGVIINPMITDPAAYKAAVDRSPASPEAKRAAMAVQPNLRKNYGAQSLDTLTKLQDEGWQKFQTTQPKDVPLEEQAARYADTLKDSATPVGKITRQLLQSMAQGVDDIGAQALGLVSGLTGSETAMKGAQSLNERSQLIELDKQIHGATDSFGLRAAGQFARLVPSLVPAAGGAKAAQVGLGLFARTTLGTKMLPALGAALRGAATPAQAAKATANIVQAGVAGSAAAGGAQTYGATIADVYTTLREKHPEMSHATALRQAQMPAILSGAVTAILTTVGGATGVEKLLANPAAVKEAFKKQFTSQLSRAGYVAKQVALGGVKEWPEEIADEVFSTVATAAASGQSVPLAMSQFVESLPELTAAIFALGGAGEGIQAIRETSKVPRDVTQPESAQVEPADPALRPEVAAAAWSSIDQLSNREDLNPADIPGMQERASVALAVAQGGSVEDLEETQLNAAGWTGRNSKGVTLPEGQIERLKDYTGPEVLEVDSAGVATISPAYRASLAQHLPEVAAAIPANHGVKIPASENAPAAPEAPRQGIPTEGQSNETAPSAPASGVDTSTLEGQRIGDFTAHFQDLGLAPAEAAQVAKYLVDKQGVIGETYVDQAITKEYPKILRELGLSGSLSTTRAQDNPLRVPADFSQRLASQSAAKTAPLSPVAGPSTSQAPESSEVQPARGSSAQGAASPARGGEDTTQGAEVAPPAASAPAAPKQAEVFKKAKASSTAPKLDFPQQERAEQLAAKIVKDGSYTEEEAAALAAEYVAQSKENNSDLAKQFKLGFIPWLSRKETEARGGVLAKGKVNAAGEPIAETDVVAQTPARPADLRRHSAWNRARLQALTSLPAGKRPAARKTLNILERALADNHALFGSLALGDSAKSLLEGSAVAVSMIDGQPVLALDLSSVLKELGNLTDAEAGITATMIEETIHAAVLTLAEKNPGKYSMGELVKRWQSLTPELRQKVWESYRAIDILNKTQPSQMPADMKSGQQWQLFNEFLRMMIQDRKFAGQVSESVTQDKSLAQWLADMLKDLGNALKALVSKASPEVQADLDTMIEEVGNLVLEMQARSKGDPSRLATLPALKPMAQKTPVAAAPVTATSPAKSAGIDSTTDNRASVLAASAPLSQTPKQRDFKPRLGSTGTAYTDSNDAIEYQWAVVDVRSLTLSNLDDGRINPDYPQELQPRDRTSAGSEAQVTDIAKNLNLDRLSASNGVGDGAPIVGPDGVVESGNGRGIGARRAHGNKSASAKAYKDRLIDRSQDFGLTDAAVNAIEQPVLVRVRKTEVNRVAFVLAANVSTIAPKREIEQAKIDAKQIVPDLFETFVPSEDGDVFTAANADFIRGFMSAIVPPAERPALIDAKGNLSQTGLRRLRNALFVYAYGDSKDILTSLSSLTEAIEADGRNIVNALIAMAPRLAEQNGRMDAGALYPLSLTEDLAKALSTYQDIKARGETVETWAAQDTLAGIGDAPSAMDRRLVTFLHDFRRKPRAMVEALNRYASAVDTAGDPKQQSLFGDEPRPSREELFALATGQTPEQEPALPSLASGTKAPTLAPATALKLYRTLTAKETLTPGQSKALETAEMSLGQTFLFDAATTRISKPAEDLRLETQTTGQARGNEQQSLFSGSKAPAPETPEETAALDAMFEAAARAKPQLDALTREIAAQFGANVKIPDKLKGRARSLDKMRTDYQGDATRLKDLARATIETQTIAQAKAVSAEIARRTGQSAKRNLFEENPVDGYRDALFNVVIDGHTVELQVHVPEILTTKHHLHHAYVVRSGVERLSAGRERRFEEQLRIDRMNRIMRRGYNTALGIDPDLGAPAEELARRAQAGKAGTSSSASSGLTRNPPLALTSSSKMGRGGSSSNAQPLPLASRTTANASARNLESGTSMNPEAPGNLEGFITQESTTETPKKQGVTITSANISDYNTSGEVTALKGRQKDWKKAFLWQSGVPVVSLAKLVSHKNEPQAVANAARFIGQAIAGQRPPRQPINVSLNSDGTYTIQDGNATAQALMLAGWKAVPVNVVPVPSLAKGRTAPDDTPDLFSFNSGLGLDILLTPAQNEAKVQQAQTLDLFGEFTDARPRPTSQRPAQPARSSRTPKLAQESAGLGDLFGQTGMAPTTGWDGSLFGDGAGFTGGSGGSGDDAAGGGTTRQPGTDPAAGNDTQGSTGADMPGLSGDAGSVDAIIRPSVGDPARNFEVPETVENLAPATDKAKIAANIEAIRLLKQLEDESRDATPEEKSKLAAYTGWGAFKEGFNAKYEEDISKYWDGVPEYRRQYMPDWLKSWEKNHRPLHKLLRESMTADEFASASASTLNAHYTAAPIIRAMWKMVDRLGFKGGRALEPSAGNGHYLGLTPSSIADKTQWQTVELDDLSARLLSKLYPEATVNESRGGNESRQISGLGFERARIPNGSLDLVISNVPFHESGPSKKGFPSLNLHNFFFAHALDKVKPGGLVAFITSESTMQNNLKQRDFIASKGDLVAAFRLPNNAFKGNAGTEVTTDIIILRKPDGTPFQGQAWRNLTEVGRQTITLVQGKDQTADELRREAARTGDIVGKEYFKGDKKAIDVSAPIMVNEYFVNHPQHALGTHTLASSMYRAGGYALVAPDTLNVTAALDALIPSLPENVMGQQSTAETKDTVLADRDDKPFSYKEQDGKIYEVQPDGSMEEAEWSTNPEMVQTWRSWRKVADAAEQLVRAETSDSFDETGLDRLRRNLNVLYDNHVMRHKPISRRFANSHKHLTSDPSYPLTAALETEVTAVDSKTGKKTYTYQKAEIFTKRIGRPIVEPSSAQTTDEALELALAWRGTIDSAYAASLLGSTVERFEAEALLRPDIFRNPDTSLLEQGEEYLSGNVRQKLETAQEAAKDDPRFAKNVEALTAAQPERKEIARIAPVLGARWIPAPVYDAFIKEVLQGSDTVEYIPAGNSWIISGPGLYKTEDHGSERKKAAALFKHALDMTEPLVYDGSGDTRTFNASATAAAKTALDKMRRAFIDFVKTSDVQVELSTPNGEPGPALPVWEATENAFNESNNSYVTPKHTGAYLKFPGLNTDYVYTKPHRRGVIARFLTTRRGMMAHGVGSGKTFNQIILAQEMRRLGLAKKPMIVVQNATLGQFAKSYLKAYPGAKVLVPSKSDFQAQNRRKMVAKIATGDWDAVLLPHSQFDLISNKESAVKAYMDSQIDELMAIVNSTKDKAKVRDLEGMIKRLKDRRQGMLDQLKARQDTAVMWEDLGIDALIMDEAHNYKSLPIITRMGRVKGVPASGNSQRAINFMLKCRDVQSRTGGKNIFLATGTPIKNSMAEAYIMMQFMAPDVLEDFNIHNFDDFATSYGQTVTEAEMAWGGTPKMETRFAKFQNGSALITMIRTMFDVAFGNESLGLDVPKIKGGEPEMVIVPATESIDRFNAWTRNVNELWKKADPTEKEEFGAVPIQTMAAGIAAALDPRLLSPNLPDDPGSKVNTAVGRVVEIYKAGAKNKTTQIIFSDLRNPFSMEYLIPFTGHPFPEYGGDGEFDLYVDVKNKLVAAGVPEKEIHLMKSGMTDTAKAALFEKVAAGEIRIIMGSTELLGVGVNIQTRLKAVHHLMPPRDFTPAMMEQRNGRIIRQGNLHAYWWADAFAKVAERVSGKSFRNAKGDILIDEAKAAIEGNPKALEAALTAVKNFEIEIVNYGTEGSMDSAIYGTLARKQRFITQLLMGEEMQDTFDDPTDPVAVNMAEMAARTLGDPDFIRRIELEKEIKDLRLQSDAFTNELAGKRSRLSRLETNLRYGDSAIDAATEEAAKYAKLWTRTAARPEGVKEDTDISDKAVYEFGGLVIDTAGKEGSVTAKLDNWLLDTSKRLERRGMTQAPASLTINGQEVPLNVYITMPNSITAGAVMDDKGRDLIKFSGAASLIQNLRRLPADLQDTVQRTRQNLADDASKAEKLRETLATIGTFPEAEKLSELELEAQEVDARLRAKSSPPETENQAQETQTRVLPPMKPVEVGLMTYDVERVIDNADILGNKLFLPDTLDRKLYKAVNAALESAGGVWSKRDKAHLFAGDPRPYLGLAEMPSLAKGRTAPLAAETLPDVPGWSALQKSLREAPSKEQGVAMLADYHQKNPTAQAALDARKAISVRVGRPIPPAWTDVQIYPPDSPLLAKGRDDKGRLQSIYSSANNQASLASKFARAKRVNALMPTIIANVKAGLTAGTEEASVLRLIYLSGFRNGGEGDTGAKVQAYGATTLRAEHVSLDGDTVAFDFTGKLGVRQQHLITDAALATDLRARMAKGGRLFNTSPDKVLAALRQAAGTQDIKVHDLRTWNATSLAAELVKANATPETETDYWLKRDAIADVVARKLGDTRKIVLESYIDPIVFAKWQESLTLEDDSERPKISRKDAATRGAAGQLGRSHEDYERSLRDELLPSAGEGGWTRGDGRLIQPALFKGRTSYDDTEANQLDRRTAGQSFIRGSRVTAEQGRAIRDVHFARVAEDGPLRQGSAFARSDFNWTPGPGLAQRLAAAFGVPVITAAQEADIQALEKNTTGVESIVYLDREAGVIYKRLQDGRGNPAGGIWPHVGHSSQNRLDWSFQPAKNPRSIGVRLAVMSDFGGTPTEIAAIGPQGHIYLKQPLSPNPGIGSQDAFIDRSGNAVTRRASGIMEIPTNLITYNAPRAYITVVKGRPWLVLDLHADNLVGDNQDAGRINDPVIGIITQDTLKNVKGLGAVVQQATQEVQQLGDRSARLFAGTKVGDRQTAFDTFRQARREAENALDDDRATVMAGVEIYQENGDDFWTVIYNRRRGVNYDPTGGFNIWQDASSGLWKSQGEDGFDRMVNDHASFNEASDWVKMQFVENWENQQVDRSFGQFERGKDEALNMLNSFVLPVGIESLQRIPWESSGGLGPTGSIYGTFSPVESNDVTWKLRIADHENTSRLHRMPDEQFIVAKHWSPESVEGAMQRAYDWLAKQKRQSTSLTGQAGVSKRDMLGSGPSKTGAIKNTTSSDPVNSLQKSRVSPNREPSPLAAIGWNHLDRHVSAKLAALTRHLDEKTGVSETVAKWQGKDDAKPFLAAFKAVKGQFMPDSILPREVAAAKREMEIKTAIGSQKAMDLVRALSGNPKFSDLVYPAEFSANPIWRKKMYLAMTGEAPLSGLPTELQKLAQRLRDMLIEQGREAVKQGRMSLETFENLREGYMPHYYKEDVQREKSLTKRFRLGLRDITAQRTTAWHISDRENKDASGEPRLVNWQGNQWRFKNQQHRDAFFEDFILQNVLDTLQMRGGQNKKLTLADLHAPAKLPEELRGRIKELVRAQRYRFQKMAPLSVQEKEDAGLIMDPVYSISRYMAQMVHDNSTAEFFNFVASKPEWISDVQVANFTEIPDNPRFGKLAGKFVMDDIAGQLLEMIESPNTALRLYDTLMGWWKTGKTVLNPGTHVRNVLGNIFFSQLAGASVWNPGNLTYYRQSLAALRDGGRTLQEAYENGVLGADFVSAELRQTLRQILPDPATIQDDGKPDALLGIGKALGKLVPEWAKNPLSKSYNHIANAYQAEDEVFKLAAYLKAKAMFAQQGTKNEELGTLAASHVRQWFPYFDGGTSGTLKMLGRTAMPFLGFYRESIRIFGNALKERPIALAAGLSVPSLITFLSALALGLDDDELEELKKDMRGKAGKLLGPTPLEGMPLFSMLLPVRSDQGQIQQFDISAVHPFVDFLGNRVEGGEGEDWWQKTLRSLVAAGPIGSLLYAQMTGKDTFGNRTFVENNMSAGEKIAARLDNAAKTVLPPLVPGGTGFQTLLNAGTRSTGKTLETRSPTQAVARAVVGLDVRNATPDLYRIADDWRKANKLPTTEGMDFGSTTPTSRARSALFAQLAQDKPNLVAIANLKKKLVEFGAPIQNAQDVQRLLFYKNPLMIISGRDNQQRFRASLTGPARAELDRAMTEYEKIKSRSQLLLRP